jgi:hypothetical protein
MRKLYYSIAAVLICGLATAQSDQSLQTSQLSNLEKQEKLNGVINQNNTSNHVNRGGGCDSLTNELTGGNSFHGNMFDVISLNTVTIETFSVTVDPGAWNIAIYYRTGTYVGSTTSSAGWIFLDSAVVNGAGEGNPVEVPVSIGLTMPASSTFAFYVTATSPGSTFYYTDGTAVGTLHSSDANLQIYEGHGGEYPFNLNNSPRVFNGSLHYCIGGVDVNELEVGSKLSIYPNPSSNNLSLDLTSFSGTQIPLTIYNSTGAIVFNETVSAGGIKIINTSSLQQGIYFLNAIINGEKTSTQFVVER